MGHTELEKYDSKVNRKILRATNRKSNYLRMDTNEFSIESVRSRIGFVSQDPFLFYGTIRDNVCYARDADESEILNALELAGASELIPPTIKRP